jgi:hypothetical protein
MTPKPKKRTRGRPSRAETSAKALKACGIDPETIDPATVDPLKVLATIAVDPSAPVSGRVAACKALLEHKPAGDRTGVGEPPSDVTERALEILRRLN